MSAVNAEYFQCDSMHSVMLRTDILASQDLNVEMYFDVSSGTKYRLGVFQYCLTKLLFVLVEVCLKCLLC